ncbi:MAG: hypothetical protein IJO32_05745 [Bacilli bacterium]|nr:hypothetical protein [Bacilli bacterium]
MTPNNKIQYKLQRKDSKKMNRFKKLKLSKDKIISIATGTIYATCLLAEMIMVAHMDIPSNNSTIEQNTSKTLSLSKLK